MPQNPPKPTFKQTKARRDATATPKASRASAQRMGALTMADQLGLPQGSVTIEPTETERLIEATIRQRAVWNAAIEKARADAQATGTAYYRPPASAQRWQSAFPTWWR